MCNYESQPKAWAEYRYKAKLIQGVWGGRASDLGHFGKVESRIVRRNAQKGVGHPFGVLKLEREELRETWPPGFKKNGGSGWGIFLNMGGQDGVF